VNLEYSKLLYHGGKLLAAIVFLVFLPAAEPQIPNAKDVVAPAVYVSLEPAVRGKTFQIAVVMKIRDGFHVNAREKSADYLIATDLKADVPAGFQAGEVSYPKGTLEEFHFSKTPVKLNVYQGTTTLRMQVTALATAPLGEQQIPVKLRYQACSTEVCLPPVTLPLVAKINVAASGAKAAHTDIFPAQ
jgi:Thiol:disulfide interchange protein DsbD, N-terminal